MFCLPLGAIGRLFLCISIIMVADCSQLTVTGYTVATTTYTGSAETVTCAAGYTGTPVPASATCGTDGSWSDSSFTGCTLQGKYGMYATSPD